MTPHNLKQCPKCPRTLQSEDLDKHIALHDKEGEICFVCGLGHLVESEDQKRVSCSDCQTTWVKKGHEKPIEDRI